LPPLAVTTAARKAVAAIDPNIPLIDISTQEQVRDSAISSERTFAMLCGSLSLLAMLLSGIGLYGLMAYHVARRTSEIGIRQALGATRRQIAGPILHEALMLAGIGIAIGAPLTFALARSIRSSFYGVGPADPITFSGATILFLVVALVAAWVPARRAAKVDPMEALRYE
jgi:ABC-type antimicrobial peptide transport system permease subunit